MPEIVFCLPLLDIATLGHVRTVPGLKAAVHQGVVWVRGIPYTEEIDVKYWSIAAAALYMADDSGYLFDMSGKVPFAKLPDVAWMPIQEFINVSPPVSAMAGQLPAPVAFRLVASANTQKGEALLTDISHLKQYAANAYRFRLQGLQHVLLGNKVLLTGNPLPPLPGTEYWRYNNVLLPAGYAFEYETTATALLLHIKANNALPVFDADGTYSLIPLQLFIPVTRSSICNIKLQEELC